MQRRNREGVMAVEEKYTRAEHLFLLRRLVAPGEATAVVDLDSNVTYRYRDRGEGEEKVRGSPLMLRSVCASFRAYLAYPCDICLLSPCPPLPLFQAVPLARIIAQTCQAETLETPPLAWPTTISTLRALFPSLCLSVCMSLSLVSLGRHLSMRR